MKPDPTRPEGLYGTRTLTKRERRITALVSDGLKNKDIAAKLRTSEHMIKNHLRLVFDKTGMSSRLELALWYVARENKCESE